MAQTYSFRLTAEGLDKFKADLTALGAEGERVFNQLRQASPALQTAFERAEQQARRAAEAAERQRAANDNVSASFTTMGQRVGSAGAQLQDFLVQAQMGTNLLTALGQQGSQFLGTFGTAGAVAGAALVLGTLGAQMLTTQESAKALSEAIERQDAAYKAVASSADTWHAGLEKEVTELLKLQGYYNTLTESVKTFEASRIQARRNALDTEAFGTTSRILEPGRGITELVEGGEWAVDPLGNPTGALLPGRGTTNTQTFAYTEATRVFRESELSTESLAALANRMRALTAGSGVVAEAARATLANVEAAAEDIAKLGQARRQLDGQTEALAGIIIPLPPSFIAPPSGSGGGTRPGEQYGPTIADYSRSIQMRMKEQEDARAAAEKAAADEEKRRQASLDRTVERYSAELARGTAEALFEGGSNALPKLATAFSRALRTAVAGALDTELFRPLVSSLFSSLGFGGSATAGGGALSGLSGMFGLNGIGTQLSGAFGGGGMLSGVGGAVSGFFGMPLFGSEALSGATNSALDAMGGAYGPAVPSSLGLGGMTVGGALGAAGLGFGAGSLVGSIVSSRRGTVGPGGTVGGAAGALTGLALSPLLGPLSPILGGVLGGAGGGLFGPTQRGMQSRSGVAGIYTLDSQGFLRIQDVGGKRADTAGFTAELQGQLDGINNALRERGLSIQGGGAWSVGSGPAAAAAGLPGNVDPNRFASMLSSNNLLYSGALGALRAQGADFNTTLSSIDWIRQVYEPLTKAATGADQFAAAIEQVSSKWGEIIARAQSLNLATDQLIAQRDKEIAAIEAQKKAQQTAMNDTAAGLFRDLTFGGGSALAPETQYFAAVSALRGAAGGLAGGGQPALDRYVSIARQALPVARNFLGTSERFGDLQAEVSRTLRGVAPGADGGLATFLEANADGTSRLIEVTASYGAQQVDILNRMVAEVSGLRAQLVGILARAAA